MVLSAIDSGTALLVLDLQKGAATLPSARPLAEIVGEANTVIAAFRRRGLPIIFVVVQPVPRGRTDHQRHLPDIPPDFLDLLPGLDRMAEDLVITKQRWGAFVNTGLEAHLRNLGVTRLLLVGASTS